MLTTRGGQLWNHWFGLKIGYKWAHKTMEFCYNGKNKMQSFNLFKETHLKLSSMI